MQLHELKTAKGYFDEIYSGKKTFEIRKNDRSFADGDLLWLREYITEPTSLEKILEAPSKVKGKYTGRSIIAEVKYFLPENTDEGLIPDYCCMAIKVLSKRYRK